MRSGTKGPGYRARARADWRTGSQCSMRPSGRTIVPLNTFTIDTADVPVTPVASDVCAAIQCAPFGTVVPDDGGPVGIGPGRRRQDLAQVHRARWRR